MSNGRGPIAHVRIANGQVALTENWGYHAPDDSRPVELEISFTSHGASEGNVHKEPVEESVSVFLTHQELFDLLKQVDEFKTEHEVLAKESV